MLIEVATAEIFVSDLTGNSFQSSAAKSEGSLRCLWMLFIKLSSFIPSFLSVFITKECWVLLNTFLYLWDDQVVLSLILLILTDFLCGNLTLCFRNTSRVVMECNPCYMLPGSVCCYFVGDFLVRIDKRIHWGCWSVNYFLVMSLWGFGRRAILVS